MPLAARDAADRVEQLIELTERLTKLVVQETELLKTKQPRELETLVEEKSRLANLYNHEMARVRADKTLIQGAPQDAKARLKAITQSFRTLLEDHGRMIDRARRISEGMIKAVGEEVRATRETVTGYGRDAAVSAYAGRTGASLAINQTV